MKRTEKDSMGEMEIEDSRYWGAKTQRSFENFRIGNEKMPAEVMRSLGIVKKACALANMDLGIMPEDIGKLIVKAADEVIAGKKARGSYGPGSPFILRLLLGPPGQNETEI